MIRDTNLSRERFVPIIAAVASAVSCWSAGSSALAQRVLGMDVSYWQGAIDQDDWNTAFSTGNRKFVFIRSSRGGTTGLDQPQGTPGGGSTATLSHRYDDSRFIQNMVRATNAGLMAGPYHFARPDVAGNTGTDEADHFMQMAGPWMRPGYLPPMFDLEAGQSQTTQEQLAQFSVDFSERIYEVMQIRPSIYINGNYSNDLAGASAGLRHQIAQPAANEPSVVSPAYPTLVSARWPAGSGNPYGGDIQNENPKDVPTALSTFYGPWDDYGDPHPWNFWQYGSGEAIPGFADTTVDGDIAHGDLEYVRDQLIPAVWWNDTSGDWSTLANWNSGQPVSQPVPGPGQAPPFSPTTPLPAVRLPGASGSGPTSGQYDTVILERPSANITVTIAGGTHNIRKMYMRETLNITGGTLTINYDPKYKVPVDGNGNPVYPNALRAAPLSAQFSGPVTLSGTGALSVYALQVDATRTFTLAGGTLTFNTINLMPHSSIPGKIAVTGDVTVNPLANYRYDSTGAIVETYGTATIANGSGSGNSGSVDLGGGTRNITVNSGVADVDLNVAVPITNGGITKSGAGTMLLSGSNTFTGNVTVNGGTLRYGHSAGLSSSTSTLVTVNNGGTLDMNSFTDTIGALAGTAGGSILRGTANLTLSATSGTNTFGGTISGSGALTKSGASIQVLGGNNTLGAVTVSAGSLLLNGTNTTGAVAVNNTATLGGTGSLSGAVTVSSGGHIAPGTSIESLDVGALALNAGAILDFEIGAPSSPGVTSDLINVTSTDGLLISGGTLNLTNDGGLNVGSYTLIDYSGALGGNVANLALGTTPSGYSYSLVNNAASTSIDLLVGVPGDYSGNHEVDSADYVLWRKNVQPLSNEVAGPMGTTTSADYDAWRIRFGGVPGSGGGEGGAFEGLGAVPEPATFALLFCALLTLTGLHPKRRR